MAGWLGGRGGASGESGVVVGLEYFDNLCFLSRNISCVLASDWVLVMWSFVDWHRSTGLVGNGHLEVRGKGGLSQICCLTCPYYAALCSRF